VSFYDPRTTLTACERQVFETHLDAGMDILELGVGTGRVTPHLAATARRFTGLDYADHMVERCREKFPNLDIRVGDAEDLSAFPDASFDAVVFAFNGLDTTTPAARRVQTLMGITRVLREGGRFIFSVHNIRAVIELRPFRGARFRRKVRHVVGTPYWSLRRAIRMFPTRAFLTGDGYVRDLVHGGLLMRMATPGKVKAELAAVGLEVVAVEGGDMPRRPLRLVTPWYYYVALKR
jgi:SAM-dependent methyltransferase